MKLKEGYIQYNAETGYMYYWSDGSGISMNSSDFFYVWHDGDWVWTKLCWSNERSCWYLGLFPEWDIQTGDKIRVATQDLFGGE